MKYGHRVPIPNFISSSISLKVLYLSRFFGTPVFRVHLLYTFCTPFYTVAVGELSSNKDTAFSIESKKHENFKIEKSEVSKTHKNRKNLQKQSKNVLFLQTKLEHMSKKL